MGDSDSIVSTLSVDLVFSSSFPYKCESYNENEGEGI